MGCVRGGWQVGAAPCFFLSQTFSAGVMSYVAEYLVTNHTRALDVRPSPLEQDMPGVVHIAAHTQYMQGEYPDT